MNQKLVELARNVDEINPRQNGLTTISPSDVDFIALLQKFEMT
jgi:hypothetical protein